MERSKFRGESDIENEQVNPAGGFGLFEKNKKDENFLSKAPVLFPDHNGLSFMPWKNNLYSRKDCFPALRDYDRAVT